MSDALNPAPGPPVHPVHMSEQFGTLYHGTGEELAPGDIIEPHQLPDRDRPLAFAATHQDMATTYARYADSPTKMGHIYEVEPLDPAEMKIYKPNYEARSEKGFRVKRKIVSHPTLGQKDTY